VYRPLTAGGCHAASLSDRQSAEAGVQYGFGALRAFTNLDMRWSLLIPGVTVVLSLGCKDPVSVPEHCDGPFNSNLAFGAWINAWDRQDRARLDRSAACLVAGCKAGVTDSCADLGYLCNHPIRSLDDSLTKTGACSVPGATRAAKKPPM
jgi:hypothetical protein